MFFTICVGRGGPKGNSAKFTKSSVFFFGKLPLQTSCVVFKLGTISPCVAEMVLFAEMTQPDGNVSLIFE